MKSKIFLAALSATFIASSAHAGFYVGGALNHFNDRNQSEAKGFSTTNATTNRVGLRSLGLEANAGYASAFGKLKYAGELFVNGGHSVSGQRNFATGASTSLRTGLSIGLVGKLGFNVNDKTTAYGRLGVVSQSSTYASKASTAAKTIDASTNAIAALVGVELETELSKNVKGFIGYDYIIPLQKKDLKDAGTILVNDYKNERQVARIGAKYFF